jgi:hypothetical protein
MNTLTELKKIIFSSTLKEEEKNEFYNILGFLPENDLLLMIKLFKENQKWIHLIYDNYKKKGNAFAINNPYEFKDMLKNEQKLLDEIDSNKDAEL